MAKNETIRVDMDREYGEIHPPINYKGEDGEEVAACFSQQLYGTKYEVYFDTNGDLIESSLTKDAAKHIAESRTRRDADEAAEKARQDVLKKAGLSSPKDAKAAPQRRQRSGTGPRVGADPNKGGENAIDLQAWYDGTEKHRFAVVQDFVFEKHAYRATNADGLRKFLEDEKIIQVKEDA